MILHHGVTDLTLPQALLLIALCLSMASEIIFIVMWLRFKIWAGTYIGRTSFMITVGLLVLSAVEVLALLHFDFDGWLRFFAWVTLTVAIVLRTIYMLQGKDSITDHHPPVQEFYEREDNGNHQ